MEIRELKIQHFRGFSEITLKPKGHVVLMGEPGAGRSDVIEAISRVLDADAARTRTTTELDFYQKDTTKPIVIGLTISSLNEELKQHFLDYLELWDTVDNKLVPESESLEEVDNPRFEWVLRLEYRAQWISEKEQCEEWVYVPKTSDPETNQYKRISWRDIEQLGFTHLRWRAAKFLDLGPRSLFRRIIEQSGNEQSINADFTTAIKEYVRAVATAAEHFSQSQQVTVALEKVIKPLQDLLLVKERSPSEVFRFTPEGGSLSGLLRSLGPSVDLDNGAGFLPVSHHGSTIVSILRISEALALSDSQNILAVDDLGDGLNPAYAVHLASVIQQRTGQVWVATRLPSVAEIFEPRAVVRLGRGRDGSRFASQLQISTSKTEVIASKNWHRNLLPALSYHSVVVVEGPHDFAALHALSIRLFKEKGDPLPASRGVCFISAGITGEGGYMNVLRLASVARSMGMRAVGIIDGDKDAQQFLQDNFELADAVINLPKGIEIEAALVKEVSEPVLRQAITDAASLAHLSPPDGLDKLSGQSLEKITIRFIKKNSLHAAFIETLPATDLPPIAVKLLRKAVEVASEESRGVIQL